jgi:hypothetical protein
VTPKGADPERDQGDTSPKDAPEGTDQEKQKETKADTLKGSPETAVIPGSEVNFLR